MPRSTIPPPWPAAAPTAPEHDRVELADLLEVGVGEHRTVARVALPAEVERHALVRDARRVDALHGLGRDLGADAVAADDADPVGHVLILEWCGSLQCSGNEKPPDSGDCAEVDGGARTPGTAFATE